MHESFLGQPRRHIMIIVRLAWAGAWGLLLASEVVLGKF